MHGGLTHASARATQRRLGAHPSIYRIIIGANRPWRASIFSWRRRWQALSSSWDVSSPEDIKRGERPNWNGARTPAVVRVDCGSDVSGYQSLALASLPIPRRMQYLWRDGRTCAAGGKWRFAQSIRLESQTLAVLFASIVTAGRDRACASWSAR